MVHTPHGGLHLFSGAANGTGPPVVLVHGVSGRGAVFGRVARGLCARVQQLFLPDLLGHGDSDVPEDGLTLPALQESFDALITNHVPRGAVLVGVSMGGLLVLRHAIQHGERLSGIVLFNPGGAPVSRAEIEAARALLSPKSHMDAKRLAQAVLVSRSSLLQHVVAVTLRRRLAVPHIQQFLASTPVEQSLHPTELHCLTVPIRLIIGQQDALLPTGTLEWFTTHLPDHATVVHLPNTGHVPMLDTPARFQAQVEAFLDTLDEADRCGIYNAHSPQEHGP